MRPKLLGRLYGYLENSPVRNPAFAQSFFGQGLEHIDRAIFAHVPRWTTSQRALAFLSPELRASLGEWDRARLLRDDACRPKSCRGGRLRATSTSKRNRCWRLTCCRRRAIAWPWRIRSKAACRSSIIASSSSRNRLPQNYKIRGMTEKYLLRRALADLLPLDIVTRTKQPYRAPDSQSFFFDGQALDYVTDLLSAERVRKAGYFDPVAVGRLVDKCRSGPGHRLCRQPGVRRHPVDDAAGRDFHSSRLRLRRARIALRKRYDAPAAGTRSTRNNFPSAASVRQVQPPVRPLPHVTDALVAFGQQALLFDDLVAVELQSDQVPLRQRADEQAVLSRPEFDRPHRRPCR